MKRLLGLVAMTAMSAAALLALPASAHQDERGQRYYGQHDERYDSQRPPPPRYERVPRPQQGFIWQAGHWVERGKRWEWANGKWMRERKGHVYVPTAWVVRDGHYHLRQARWERDLRWEREQRYAERGDRRTAYHDTDRDGVRNGRDGRPGDPYRY